MDQRTYDLVWSQDWDSLSRQLLEYAIRRTGRYYWRNGSVCDPVPGRSTGDRALVAGWTAQDVVQHIIDKTCRGERAWDPDRGELFPWLKQQVDSVVDALARSRPQKHETVLVEPEDDETEMLRDRQERRAIVVVGNPDPTESLSPEEVLLKKEGQERASELAERQCNLIYRAVNGDPELQAVVDAIMDGRGTKRRDLAAAIGVSPEEITNRRKRIRRRLTKLQDEE